MIAAAGAGFAMATVFGKVRWPSQFGVRLFELAMDGAWRRIWELVRQVSVDGSQAPDDDSPGEQ